MRPIFFFLKPFDLTTFFSWVCLVWGFSDAEKMFMRLRDRSDNFLISADGSQTTDKNFSVYVDKLGFNVILQ